MAEMILVGLAVVEGEKLTPPIWSGLRRAGGLGGGLRVAGRRKDRAAAWGDDRTVGGRTVGSWRDFFFFWNFHSEKIK